MSEFVEECRREWGRLGVPDPIANEMAADLEADLAEAKAEGGSAEDVLGNSAFDPRRFAAAWAGARGVTRPLTPKGSSSWRSPAAIALTVLLGILVISAGLVLLSGHDARSVAFVAPFAAHRFVAGRGPFQYLVPGPMRIVVPPPFGQAFVGTQIVGGNFHPIAWLFLIVGVVGLALLAVFYWSPWLGARRYSRNERRAAPSWN